jgi:hypothetical protein
MPSINKQITSGLPKGIYAGLTFDEQLAIEKIARRAVDLGKRNALIIPAIEFIIPIAACHRFVHRLRLEEFANADDFNLVHDAFGIRRHMNDDLTALRNSFLPGFARQS